MKKIVVTGIGAVTAIGNTADDYWNNLIDGKCGMRTFTRVPTELHETTVAAEVDDSFEAEAAKYPWLKFTGSHKDFCDNIRFVSYEFSRQ